MGLFELFRRQQSKVVQTGDSYEDVLQENANNAPLEPVPGEILEQGVNIPTILSAKFLFHHQPVINEQTLFEELKQKYSGITKLLTGKQILYNFNIHDKNSDNEVLVECSIQLTDDMLMQTLPDEAFRQNWHWKEAGELARSCNYEVLLTEVLSGKLNYKQRTEIFIDFVAAAISATNPSVIYYKNAQKLLAPNDILACHTSIDPDILHPLSNIRMFKVSDSSTGELLMDTIGLNALGLPDFEIVFNNQNPEKIAELLLKYCYFVYDIGDNILHGEYLESTTSDEKWRCEKRVSLLPPYRVVLHVSVGE